jgi:Kelch motif
MHLTYNVSIAVPPVVVQARIAGQAVCLGDQVYIIGGWDPGLKRDGGEILNDVWALDLETLEWRQQQLSSEVSSLTFTF